jgi:hypothetical protein
MCTGGILRDPPGLFRKNRTGSWGWPVKIVFLGCFYLNAWPESSRRSCGENVTDSNAHGVGLESCFNRFSNGLSGRAVLHVEFLGLFWYFAPGVAPAPLFFLDHGHIGKDAHERGE